MTIEVPALVTSVTQPQYLLTTSSLLVGTPFGDQVLGASNIADLSVNSIYTSPLTTCFVGYDFGANYQVITSEIRFIPNQRWTIDAARQLSAAVF